MLGAWWATMLPLFILFNVLIRVSNWWLVVQWVIEVFLRVNLQLRLLGDWCAMLLGPLLLHWETWATITTFMTVPAVHVIIPFGLFQPLIIIQVTRIIVRVPGANAFSFVSGASWFLSLRIFACSRREIRDFDLCKSWRAWFPRISSESTCLETGARDAGCFTSWSMRAAQLRKIVHLCSNMTILVYLYSNCNFNLQINWPIIIPILL